MELIMLLNEKINNFVWGAPMLILLLGTGIYLTVRQGWPQIRHFGYMMKNTIGKIKEKGDGAGEITPYQAVATAMAATVGVGNIAGVATAIASGGPGAIFWMWLSAIFGMCTKYSEAILAVNFRDKLPDGSYIGGPMKYIEKGLNAKWLAVIFAMFGGLACFGTGNMVQSNSVAQVMKTSFGISPKITGIALAILVGIVIIGGLKNIVKVTSILVPFMAVAYIIGGIVLIVINFRNIPTAFGLIFSTAFTGTAAIGGFLGATVKTSINKGLARGIFSNEAGLGSAPIAHATAKVSHPCQQGLWGIFEVFVDTIVICSITALSIILTGTWQTGETGAALTAMAFDKALPGFGTYIIGVSIIFFAYSTILGWEYYGEKCWEYIFGPSIRIPYRIIWLPLLVVGAVGGLEFVWDLSDTLNGLMAIPNLIGLLGCSPILIKLTREYFSEKANANIESK